MDGCTILITRMHVQVHAYMQECVREGYTERKSACINFVYMHTKDLKDYTGGGV